MLTGWMAGRGEIWQHEDRMVVGGCEKASGQDGPIGERDSNEFVHSDLGLV